MELVFEFFVFCIRLIKDGGGGGIRRERFFLVFMLLEVFTFFKRFIEVSEVNDFFY